MPIGFKRATDVTFHVPVTSAQAATANVFDTEGVAWTDYTIPAQFTPGVAKRYSLSQNGYIFLGECSIKVDPKYESLVASGSHLTIGSVEWNYKQISELGAGFGNDRIVLALTRKKSA